MKYWAVIQAMPADELRRTLAELERTVLDGVWVPQLFSPPFPTMAAAAMATTSLKLGSGIALAFTRSPLETALNALDVDLLSGGRTVLGLGTSIRDFNEQLHGVRYGKPIAHLREVVRIVRDVIEKGHAGGLGLYDGEYHTVDLRRFRLAGKPARASIPIYLPALFESSIGLAAEIGDGLTGHPMWSTRWIAEHVARILDERLPAAGRTRADFHVNLWAYVAIDDDRRRARDEARGTVAFYASIAQYERYFAAHGFGGAAQAIASAAARGDALGMAAAVPDEMVDTFLIAGTPADARARAEELGGHADSLTLVPPGTDGSLPGTRVAEYREAIARTFFT